MLKEMPSTRQINVHKREQKVFNVQLQILAGCLGIYFYPKKYYSFFFKVPFSEVHITKNPKFRLICSDLPMVLFMINNFTDPSTIGTKNDFLWTHIKYKTNWSILMWLNKSYFALISNDLYKRPGSNITTLMAQAVCLEILARKVRSREIKVLVVSLT